MKLQEIYNILCEIAPMSLSDEFCKVFNAYDNSGIIAETDGEITTAVFALDLTKRSAEFAKAAGAELIVTHHPAIYYPVKKVDGALLEAVRAGMGIISMHLNFDSAERGIDYYLAKAIGAKNCAVLRTLGSGGYGRLFELGLPLGEIYSRIENELSTKKSRLYGDRERVIKTAASFCGAGFDAELSKNADLIVSSDIRHHELKWALDEGKAVIDVTHYASENYGLNAIYRDLLNDERLKNLKLLYFNDARFE